VSLSSVVRYDNPDTTELLRLPESSTSQKAAAPHMHSGCEAWKLDTSYDLRILLYHPVQNRLGAVAFRL